MIVSYPVAFVVLITATLSDRWNGCGSDRIMPLSLMSGSLEPRTWGGVAIVIEYAAFPGSLFWLSPRRPSPLRQPTERRRASVVVVVVVV